MDLFRELRQIRDQFAPIAEEMGVPSVRSLIVVTRTAIESTYLEIYPKPSIVDSPPRWISSPDGTRIQIEVDNFEIKGISKRYSKEELAGRGVSYVVDGELVDDRVVGGIVADAIPGFAIQDKGITWSMTIRRRKTRETERA